MVYGNLLVYEKTAFPVGSIDNNARLGGAPTSLANSPTDGHIQRLL